MYGLDLVKTVFLNPINVQIKIKDQFKITDTERMRNAKKQGADIIQKYLLSTNPRHLYNPLSHLKLYEIF